MFNQHVFILFCFVLLSILCLPTLALANQVGLTVTEDAIGCLGDYETDWDAWDLETDAQVQKSETLSVIVNFSVSRNFETVGIKPFVSYIRDAVGNSVDAGSVLHLKIGQLDIAAGASFRGANPVGTPLEDRFDATDTPVQVKPAGYSPNAYSLPAANNINAVLKTGFDMKTLKTQLTGYLPLTARDIVPIVLISRSQTRLHLTQQFSVSLIVDARTYLHADGVALQWTPIGGVTFQF